MDIKEIIQAVSEYRASKEDLNLLYKLVGKSNGLRGRQKITDHWREGRDGWAFTSNAHGDMGETLSFHYETTSIMLKYLARFAG